MRRIAGLMVAAAALAACDGATGPAGGPMVVVMFESVAASSGQAGAGVAGQMAGAFLVIDGSNGVLRVDTAHAILDRFELRRADRDEACEGLEHSNACERFRAPPLLMQLPLAGGARTAVSAEVPPAPYDRLRFEIEHLDNNEENPVRAQQIAQLFEAIRGEFPDWPRKASMRVAGTFTPLGGSPRPFRAYLDAEVELRLEFATPLVVRADDELRVVTVDVDARDWFANADGTVIDLSEFDFPSTGRLLEFRVRIRDGFKRVRHDG
jgi:hypothetical protein